MTDENRTTYERNILFTFFKSLRMWLDSDWVCQGKHRTEQVVVETDYAVKVQPADWERHKNVYTGEILDIKSSHYGKVWRLKDDE